MMELFVKKSTSYLMITIESRALQRSGAKLADLQLRVSPFLWFPLTAAQPPAPRSARFLFDHRSRDFSARSTPVQLRSHKLTPSMQT